MLLSEMASKLSECGLLIASNGDTDIKNITFDSRKVTQNTLFTCKGAKFKSEYLTDSIRLGASAYMSEVKYDVDIPYLIVNDIRRAMSIVALLFYGYPSRSFKTVGVTGTKGKTTTTFFLKNIFDEFTGSPNAAITTIEVITGKEKKSAVLTTPEAYDLQEILSEVRENNVGFLTMEVSSQALKVDRVFGMNYNVGIFLNIGDDHISPNEHPDWNDYFESKLKLFSLCDIAIVNADEEHSREMILRAKSDSNRVFTYGKAKDADFRLTDVRKSGEYLDFDIVTPEGNFESYTIAMHGGFNAENALAAIIAAKQLGIDNASIARGLKKTLVPGRMDMFFNEKTGVRVVVDFAHNKLSFNKLFETLKNDYPDNRLGVIIGSAGGKGFQRRKAIGEVLTKYADYAILTDCDSNFEDTQSICMDILEHVDTSVLTDCKIILDREEAIKTALREAKRGDVIALVARGEESRRWWKGEILQCTSDVELAKLYCDGKL